MKYGKLKNDKRGLTMLIAIIVSIFVLAIGTSLVSLALKQLLLTGSGRDSQLAFYAANTGIECALNWDFKRFDEDEDDELEYVFPLTDSEELIEQEAVSYSNNDIRCAGFDIVSGGTGGGHSVEVPSYVSQFYTSNGGWKHATGTNTWTFRFPIQNLTVPNLDGDNMTCVQVTVTKTLSNGETRTRIDSNGINTCDPENDPRAVERGLQVQYSS